jgi:hypothetical protein
MKNGVPLIDVFCGENSPFCYERKVPSNMIRATFWEKIQNIRHISRKRVFFFLGKDLVRFLGSFSSFEIATLS